MKKIPTLFIRGKDGKVTREKNYFCNWVFEGKGKALVKLDGTSCMISERGFFKRRTFDKDTILPEGFILEHKDKETGKSIGWVRVTGKCRGILNAMLPEDKWHNEAYKFYTKGFGTAELLGPKINGNAEGMSHHILRLHSECRELKDCPTGYDELIEYLRPLNIEGIVWHGKGGKMAKIKKRDFGLKRKE